MSNSLWPHGLWPARLLCPWDFPGKNTGVLCHFLLQWIFLIQGLNIWLLHLLHWQTDYLPLSHQGSHVPFFHKDPNVGAFDRLATVLSSASSELKCLVFGPLCSWTTVQFSHSVVSNSLRPHGLQHARLPCPSATPGAYTNSCPSCRWCHPTVSIQPSHPLSSRSPSAFNVSQHQGLFQWVSSSH